MKIIILVTFLILVETEMHAQGWGLKTINFENTEHLDTSLFKLDNASCWTIGKPNKSILDSAFSLPNAIITDTVNPYSVNCNSSFIIKLSSDFCYTMSFKLKYDTEYCMDGLIIEMTVDTGETWINLCDNYTYYEHETSFPGHWHDLDMPINDTCTLFNGEVGISGSGSQLINMNFGWYPVLRSLWEPWRIRFRFISDSNDTFQDGFLIDEIKIDQYNCTGGIVENQFQDFVVFPNPASDLLYLNSNVIMKDIRIINSVGETVLVAENNISPINIYALPAGFYFTCVSGFNAQKFIKL